ncbi:sensor histidine kinase [Siminovitchia terrae]|uniref:histidine kinase n=1 Tax=Siminovitchia terrae TaxID=1914933 RepID=A0A429X6Q7_SIMTE|nr:sensor histidine kinase [Siminovitchia terrae]RST59118.1 HAMP domain-containing histidine kinase [Siminovitchia terrae]GIN90265.1 sensor histidine kinase [Siminovitchia terrae]GIN94225.1 sensor histidine kinase [Siminovitchia terrae]
MNLFIREHLPLIIINCLQMTVMILVFWLDGYRSVPLVLYSLFLSVFFLTVYLVYRYITHKDFYKRLAQPMKRFDEAFETFQSAPLTEALSNLLKSQHTLHLNERQYQEKRRNDHLTFINQWVHQMKTPLSVIELITQENDEEYMTSIRGETDKLEKGLEMVLYSARLETFEHDFQVQQVSLRKITEQAIRENKRLFIKNEVYPELHVQSTVVESDEKWLIFIINQLITNAVKYSAGKSRKVIISETRQSAQVELIVQDFGIGIAKTDVKRVFNPFFTGENGRLYRESTGMGLYLAKEVCEKLGHGIELESLQGEGTTVKLIFQM